MSLSTDLQFSHQAPLRGTQSLVHILGACVRHPQLLAIELAWRWAFGIPALLILFYQGTLMLSRTPLPPGGISNLSLADPNTAALVAANYSAAILPPIERLAWWLGPVLAVGWAFSSGIGRSLLLRRMVAGSSPEPGTLIGLQALRIGALAGTGVAWFLAVHAIAHATLAGSSLSEDGAPNVLGYFAAVITLSLALFTLWALASWIFSIAPLIAVLEKRSLASSLMRSLHLGRLTPKLVEVNFVLGIVKMALIVLLMVFCATPLPFESIANGTPLYVYWGLLTVLYMAASDFFQVARLAAFIDFWKAGLAFRAVPAKASTSR